MRLSVEVDESGKLWVLLNFSSLLRLVRLRIVNASQIRRTDRMLSRWLVYDWADLLPQHLHVLPREIGFLLLILVLALLLFDEALMLLGT